MLFKSMRVEESPIEPLKGIALLRKVKELGDVSSSDLIQACGYVSKKEDGSLRLNKTAFLKALYGSKGVNMAEENDIDESSSAKSEPNNEIVSEKNADELKADREIVLEAVKKDGDALQYAADELKADREIVLEAVQQSGDAFQFAADELKADRNLVLAAVQSDGMALEFVDEKLKADREIVLEAVKKDGDAFKFAAEELKAKLLEEGLFEDN